MGDVELGVWYGEWVIGRWSLNRSDYCFSVSFSLLHL